MWHIVITSMASYTGSDEFRADCGSLSDKGLLQDDDDVNSAAGARREMRCGCEDRQLSACEGNSGSSAANHSLPHFHSSHCAQCTACLTKPDSDLDDDKGDGTDDHDNDVDVRMRYWREAGRALRSFLSQTSETNLLFGNDDALVINADIARRQEPANHSAATAYRPQYSTASSTDLCSNDCPSSPGKSCSVGGRLPADDLVVLDDDDPRTSFVPLLSELRQKISCLDNGCQDDLLSTSWQRRERAKSKGRSKSTQLSTWSEFSSSEEPDDSHWFSSKPDPCRRKCHGGRRPKSDERFAEDLWARSCSEEPGCCSADRLLVNRHSSGRRRRKKSTTEKTSLFSDDRVLRDGLPPLRASQTNEWTTWHHDGVSFTDCPADVESNATDSENTGHVSDDDDEENEYDNTMINGNTSSVVTPLACSFHCIPPGNSERQTARLTAAGLDYSPVNSPVCDGDRHCMSSEDELSAALRKINISDNDSCHCSSQSSYSFRGIL